ncbi:MAG: VPLPA-CTERM sorting domain-containing protein [Pseudomonadota bacterium]
MKQIIGLAAAIMMGPMAASAATTTVSYADGGGSITLADGDSLVIQEQNAAPPNPLAFSYQISTTGPGTISIDNGPLNLFGEFDNFEMVLSSAPLARSTGGFDLSSNVLDVLVPSFTDPGQPTEFGALMVSFDVPTELPSTFFINIGYDFGKTPDNVTTISFEGLTAVPLPASAFMLLAALAGFGFVSRKRAEA